MLGTAGTADEVCLVILSGDARIISGTFDTGMLTGRKSVFDKIATLFICRCSVTGRSGPAVMSNLLSAVRREMTASATAAGADKMRSNTRGRHHPACLQHPA